MRLLCNCRFSGRWLGHSAKFVYLSARNSRALSTIASLTAYITISSSFLAAQVLQPGPRLPRTSGSFWTEHARVPIETDSSTEVVRLAIGRSVVLSTDRPLLRIYVGDRKVVSSYASGAREEVVSAKSCGVSTLILWDVLGRRTIYTVFADLDTESLSQAVSSALPDANVIVAARGDRVYLSGTVRSDLEFEQAAKIAAAYTKDVVNAIRVQAVHGPQIELKLRIVEVDRSRLEQYGVNFFALGSSTLGNTSTQQFATTVLAASSAQSTPTVSDPLNLLLYSGKLNAGVTVKDLEQKQILQVLAEPTITTLSGMPARFLSGGEFPMPIVQGGTGSSTAITIVFKPYGVKVDFTPTANADGTIRLKVAPEVSALDYTNAVTISGFTVPALSTRRAETEVELIDGQSFVISGLLDHRTTDSLSRMPGVANIPILGQLFRSKGITHSTVELVVLVTARVVHPLAHGDPPPEPRMVIPNLDSRRFDNDVVGHAKVSRPVSSSNDALPAGASSSQASPLAASSRALNAGKSSPLPENAAKPIMDPQGEVRKP